MVFDSTYIYGANCTAKFQWESVWGGHSGVKIPWSLKC